MSPAFQPQSRRTHKACHKLQDRHPPARRKNITQEQLAAMARVDQSRVPKIENGSPRVTLDAMVMLLFVLGGTLADLTGPLMDEHTATTSIDQASPRRCDQFAYRLRGHVPRGHIGLFERDVHVLARRKKQGGIRQTVPQGERIDVDGQLVAGVVSSNRQEFVSRPSSQRLANQFVPDGLG